MESFIIPFIVCFAVTAIGVFFERLSMSRQTKRLRREVRHFARIADWYATHPGEHGPGWCFLAWREGEPFVSTSMLERSERENQDGG